MIFGLIFFVRPEMKCDLHKSSVEALVCDSSSFSSLRRSSYYMIAAGAGYYEALKEVGKEQSDFLHHLVHNIRTFLLLEWFHILYDCYYRRLTNLE